MAHSQIALREEEVCNAHTALTRAHTDAAKLSALLKTHLLAVSSPNPAEIKERAIKIGTALARVARAERACGSCYGRDHEFSKSYEDMLLHHRRAFVDFERLSQELETSVSPRCGDIAALAGDIEHELNLAARAHKRVSVR